MKHIHTGISIPRKTDRLLMLLCCIAVVLLTTSGCGRKGDPFLSEPLAPARVRAASAVCRPGEILVEWQMPRNNTDETVLLDLAGVQVFRAQTTFADYCATCPQRYELLFDYEYRGPGGQRPEKSRITYRDTAVKPGNVYTYRLNAYNVAGTAGPAAGPLVMHYDTALRSPQALAVERKDSLASLTWQPVKELADGRAADDAVGYRVYRRTETGVYGQPLNEEMIEETFFEDTPPEFDVVYYYMLRSVRAREQALIESDASAEVRFEYYDMTPPDAPLFLTAIARKDGVMLKWMAKTEEGFAGYHVYRRTPGRGEFRRLTSELLTENSWVDTTAVRRRRYEYAVTAIDDSLSANESVFSESTILRYISD